MTPPASITLSLHLTGQSIDWMEDIASRASVPLIMVRRAASGQPINVDAFLRLCAVGGIDPVLGFASPSRSPGSFSSNAFAIAVKIARLQRNETQRQFAKSAKCSVAAVCRIERGDSVCVATMLAACAFLRRHPYDFVVNSAPDPRLPSAIGGKDGRPERAREVAMK